MPTTSTVYHGIRLTKTCSWPRFSKTKLRARIKALTHIWGLGASSTDRHIKNRSEARKGEKQVIEFLRWPFPHSVSEKPLRAARMVLEHIALSLEGSTENASQSSSQKGEEKEGIGLVPPISCFSWSGFISGGLTPSNPQFTSSVPLSSLSKADPMSPFHPALKKKAMCHE